MGTVHSSTVVTVSGGSISTNLRTMAYSWDNRVKFVVRYMYDIDNNGFLDKNDFDCLAVKTTLIEGRGNWDTNAYETNKSIMDALWYEIADLADFNKDRQVSVDEFKKAIQTNCSGKKYSEFPSAFRGFIANNFKTIDVDGDGFVGLNEFRLDCINRIPVADIKEIDDAYKNLISEEDTKLGGISLDRYQELYAEFLSNQDETCKARFLFGPLQEL